MILCKTCRYANWLVKEEKGIKRWEFLSCDLHENNEVADIADICDDFEEFEISLDDFEEDPDIAWKEAHGE